ncbi:MAG: SYNERG-CTERM sorting domain-containing protein, partial [Synergistaceae bacterium]|nr:SYNERG-CTERM sorting domain-containing protein [Synergistaceae bacterium]
LSFQVIPGNVDFVNGWGFFLYHAAPVIDKSYSNTFPDPVIDLTPASGDMSSGEGNSYAHSSGGGCEAGFGGLAVIMIVGLGALIRRK